VEDVWQRHAVGESKRGEFLVAPDQSCVGVICAAIRVEHELAVTFPRTDSSGWTLIKMSTLNSRDDLDYCCAIRRWWRVLRSRRRAISWRRRNVHVGQAGVRDRYTDAIRLL
jgi:hypothetical protein